MSSSTRTVTYEFRRTDPVSTPVGRVPRVTRFLAIAHTIDGRIRFGEIRDWAAAARLVGVTRARMTQLAHLLLLAPKIQEGILNLPNVTRGPDPVTERALRMAVAEVDWRSQKVTWAVRELVASHPHPP
jgi:hypothetical protein